MIFFNDNSGSIVWTPPVTNEGGGMEISKYLMEGGWKKLNINGRHNQRGGGGRSENRGDNPFRSNFDRCHKRYLTKLPTYDPMSQ